jgi:ABC-type transport system involved in cytochrome bd biosynthesis fused ATPase/permease subunit
MRAMSLATKPDYDPIAVLEDAKAACKNPIKISWENVFFEVEVPASSGDKKDNPSLGKTKKKQIVKSVSGFAMPGQFTVIMGSSGAGKTSLLNILADRIRVVSKNTKLSGNILFNDRIPVDK